MSDVDVLFAMIASIFIGVLSVLVTDTILERFKK